MPSLLPDYEYDIFISYRQKDNLPSRSSGRQVSNGWVTEFVDNLKKELDATFKDDISIYFDENPHDGLLETHNVGRSLEAKLKSIILIPVISQTYCDPNSFAWEHEFLAFSRMLAEDELGARVTLANGNIADRILPIRIHDIEAEDMALFERTTGSIMRPVDFIYRLPGVNRSLRAIDDEQIRDPEQILYRDQINKVANAIKEIINSLRKAGTSNLSSDQARPVNLAPVPEAKESMASHTEIVPESTTKSKTKRNTLLVIALIVLTAIIVYVPGMINKSKARNELIPEIQRLVDSNFSAPVEAYNLAIVAKESLPEDTTLQALFERASRVADFETDPPGAEVYWQDYNTPDAAWNLVGTTPILAARVPRPYLRFKFKKEGYQNINFAGPWAYGTLWNGKNVLKLDKVGDLPKNMVRIPKKETYMLVVGLEQHGGVIVDEFLVDRFEVTNKEYKAFVKDGGYDNIEYWQNPIMQDGREINLDEARKLFVDKTGRVGPATWEAGSYTNGSGNHPVTGVSWYEAAAYANYKQKRLPTVYQWSNYAETSRTEFIEPMSNFNQKSPVEVGSLAGYSTYGVYDVAGNAREWCVNYGNDLELKYILGGGWNDPSYSFNDAYTQPALDRSIGNGFRCVKSLTDQVDTTQVGEIKLAFRDYSKEKPIDDVSFELIRSQFDYDKKALEPKVKTVLTHDDYTVQKATFAAAYNDERMTAYLYIPANHNRAMQPIIFFPGSNDIHSRKFKVERVLGGLDFIVKSGRVLIYPVLKGTHERFDELNSDLPDESVFYKDHLIMWRKDIGRIIDYLETRDDIDVTNLGYLGWSWGGYMGGIMPAVETRIKAVVLNVGGMVMNTSLPAADQINFLPRVKQPVLMLNGEHDMFFPLETSQKYMFEFLGTPAKDKKKIIYSTGHLVPKTEFVKETLFWFDKYLGEVN